MQSKITKAADYIDTAADYVTNEETIAEKRMVNLQRILDIHFVIGLKVVDGFRQVVSMIGKPCAKQPGQKT